MTDTPTASDGGLLLAACREHADDDTPRLMYADWLDEQGSASVPCPKCNGTGWKYAGPTGQPRCPDCTNSSQNKTPHGAPASLRCASCKLVWKPPKCHPCKGTGFVADTSNADRAELIRLQVRMATELCHEYGDTKRVAELLTVNADRLRRGPNCGKCEGLGEIRQQEVGMLWGDTSETPTGKGRVFSCPHCWGTGDACGLMRRTIRDTEDKGGSEDWLHRIEYVRGMRRVHARADDIWQRTVGNKHGELDAVTWTPTAWAKAVCRHHPDVAEMWVEDREPESWTHNGGDSWSWYLDGLTTDLATIPEPVFDALCGWDAISDGRKAWLSRDVARVALARAVVRWVHAHPAD